MDICRKVGKAGAFEVRKRREAGLLELMVKPVNLARVEGMLRRVLGLKG